MTEISSSKTMAATPNRITKFGDEHSSLFDQYERSAIEVELNRAILGRSYSEPTMARFRPASLLILQQRRAPPPPPPARQSQTPRPSSSKLLKSLKKMLIKPIMMSKKRWQRFTTSKVPPGGNQHLHEYDCKAFTRSLSRFNFEVTY